MNLNSTIHVAISLVIFDLMAGSRALPSQTGKYRLSKVSNLKWSVQDINFDGDTQKRVSSRSVSDILTSIEDRIRLLEAYENTYKLTRIDFTLEQMSQRMAAIESKMTRLEVSIDMKMAKIEETLDSSERRSEVRTESISRKIQNLNDRIETKVSIGDNRNPI